MERKHHIGQEHHKRALDAPTLTLTESNTGAFKTSTVISFASEKTMKITSLVTRLTTKTLTSTLVPEAMTMSISTQTAVCRKRCCEFERWLADFCFVAYAYANYY